MNEINLKVIHLSLSLLIREYTLELKKPLQPADVLLLEERVIEAKVAKEKISRKLGWS